MRRRFAFVAVSAAAVGYLLRCEAQRRLRLLRDRRKTRRPRGRVMLASIEHRYAEEWGGWRGACFCGKQRTDPIHQGASGAAR